ncbi:MAG: LacI family DNA-binding transcriptional regulator [Luteitalea sp.]|nr:LacI family DNA-binding transcriptional regulator [Luteitalea sp.]
MPVSPRITLEEIARAAKVSVATASRAINKTGRVSADAERRVRSATMRLGAERQRAGRTRILCFLLANRPMLHPFHAQVLMGAQAYAAEHGNHILFFPFDYGPDVPAEEIRLPLLLDRRGLVDGYVVGGLSSPNLLALLRRMGLPFAVLANNVLGEWRSEEFDTVWMDDVGGAYELTRYLYGAGHRAIWFLSNRRFPTARMYQGYARAMEEAGLEPKLIVSDSADERDSGYIAAKGLLSGRERVTAIFAHSDSAAHGAYDAAGGCGLKIPEDISIAGFGDRPEAAALSPPLITVWGYPDQTGRRLAELVLKRIADPGGPPMTVTLPTKLIRRDSCGRAKEEAPPALTGDLTASA